MSDQVNFKIENGIIQTVKSPRTQFKENPLTILKTIGVAIEYNLEIESLTLKRIKDMGYVLQRVPKEELVHELNLILQSDNVYIGLKMLWEHRIFNFIIPELAIQWNYNQNSKYHNLQLWDHTARVVESAQKAGEPINVLIACLLHDVGKPFVRTDKWESNGLKVINPINKDNIQYIKTNYVHHESVGSRIAYRILDYLKFSSKDKNEIVEMIRNHLKTNSRLREYDNAHKSKLAEELDGK